MPIITQEIIEQQIDNVQEQIENPFDGDGMDDIQLENYELEY